MRKSAVFFAILGLIALVCVINLVLRGPRAPEAVPRAPGPGPVPASPPPPPRVVQSNAPPTLGEGVEVSLVDAVTGEPVEGAVVKLKEVKAGEGERSYDFTEEGSGRYRTGESPLQGPHALSATAPGYECLRRDLKMSSQGRRLHAEMRPLTDVVVIVEDASGAPVPDAEVVLGTAGWGVFRCIQPADSDEPVRLQIEYQGASDAEGTVVFSALVPGEGYSVSVRAGDMEPALLRDVHVEPANPHIVHVVLQEGAGIVGRIRDAEGAPGSGFTIICRRRGAGSTDGFVIMEAEDSTLSRDDGYFELRGLSPGFKGLTVARRSRNRLETCVVEVTVRRGETHDCGVIGPTPLSEGGAHLRVQVVDESGSALSGARVTVMKDNPDPVDDDVSTDESGWCHVLGLNPGPVTIGVDSNAGLFITETVRLKLAAGEEKEVLVTLKRQDPTQFRKLVVYAKSDEPVDLTPERWVDHRVSPYVESDEGEWASPSWQIEPDENGDYFVLSGLRPGQYWVSLIGDGYVSRPEPVFVEAPESEVEVTLEEAVGIKGRIVDASTGAGVSGTIVRLLEARAAPENRSRALHAKVESDGQGNFVLRAFGSWEDRGLLEVRAPGYVKKIVEIHPGVGDVGQIGLSRGE